MRRLSLKSKKGKGATNNESVENIQEDTDAQGNGNMAPLNNEDEQVGEEMDAAGSKKVKRGKANASEDTEDIDNGNDSNEDDSPSTAKGRKPKRGKKRASAPTNFEEQAEEESEDEDVQNGSEINQNSPAADKGRKGKRGKKNTPGNKKKGKQEAVEKQDTEEEEEYEVEKVVNHRVVKGVKQFLIRWKGYGEDQDTWEAEGDLNCSELIKKYLAENTDNPKGKRGQSGQNAVPKKKVKVGSEETEEGEKVYEVEKVVEVHFKKNGDREFLIRWKGFSSDEDTWEPEANLNCPELIEKFMKKVDKAREVTARELRVNPQATSRFTLNAVQAGRRLSRRHQGVQRATYYNSE